MQNVGLIWQQVRVRNGPSDSLKRSLVQGLVARNLAIANRVFGESPCIDWHSPQGGTVAFPALLGRIASMNDWQRLAQSGTLAVPGSCFGAPQHCRISLASEDEDFERAAEEVCSFCSAMPIGDNFGKTQR